MGKIPEIVLLICCILETLDRAQAPRLEFCNPKRIRGRVPSMLSIQYLRKGPFHYSRHHNHKFQLIKEEKQTVHIQRDKDIHYILLHVYLGAAQ